MVDTCRHRIRGLSPGWAGRIIRALQPRQPKPRPGQKRGVRVQFLVLVEVTLTEKDGADDTQAIAVAKRKLPKRDREGLNQVRVVRTGTEEFRYLSMAEYAILGDD